MSNFSRWHSGSAVLLTLGMTAGAVAPLVISAPTLAASFADVSFSYWARPFIETLSEKNIIAGFPGGQYRPNEAVTRAQFAAIITKSFNKDTTRASRTFSDVPANYWGAEAINQAYRTGFMTGYPDGTFRPNEKIPRAQVLVALASGLGYSPSSSTSTILNVYSDAKDIPNYAVDPVAAATQKQMVVNYPDTQFLRPQEISTRADVAAFVYQSLVSRGQLSAIAPNSETARYIVGGTTGSTATNTTSTTTPTTTPTTNPETTNTNPDLKVASGSSIDVKYPGATSDQVNVVIAPGQTVDMTLEVATDFKNAKGNILIPKGSKIEGQLRPISITGTQTNATQFVANKLTIGNNTYNISANSNPIAATQNVSPQTLQGAVITKSAQTILGSIVGNQTNIGDVVGNIIGGSGTPTTQSSVITVNPATQLDLQVNSDFFVSST